MKPSGKTINVSQYRNNNIINVNAIPNNMNVKMKNGRKGAVLVDSNTIFKKNPILKKALEEIKIDTSNLGNQVIPNTYIMILTKCYMNFLPFLRLAGNTVPLPSPEYVFDIYTPDEVYQLCFVAFSIFEIFVNIFNFESDPELEAWSAVLILKASQSQSEFENYLRLHVGSESDALLSNNTQMGGGKDNIKSTLEAIKNFVATGFNAQAWQGKDIKTLVNNYPNTSESDSDIVFKILEKIYDNNKDQAQRVYDGYLEQQISTNVATTSGSNARENNAIKTIVSSDGGPLYFQQNQSQTSQVKAAENNYKRTLSQTQTGLMIQNKKKDMVTHTALLEARFTDRIKRYLADYLAKLQPEKNKKLSELYLQKAIEIFSKLYNSTELKKIEVPYKGKTIQISLQNTVNVINTHDPGFKNAVKEGNTQKIMEVLEKNTSVVFSELASNPYVWGFASLFAYTGYKAYDLFTTIDRRDLRNTNGYYIGNMKGDTIFVPYGKVHVKKDLKMKIRYHKNTVVVRDDGAVQDVISRQIKNATSYTLGNVGKWFSEKSGFFAINSINVKKAETFIPPDQILSGMTSANPVSIGEAQRLLNITFTNNQTLTTIDQMAAVLVVDCDNLESCFTTKSVNDLDQYSTYDFLAGVTTPLSKEEQNALKAEGKKINPLTKTTYLNDKLSWTSFGASCYAFDKQLIAAGVKGAAGAGLGAITFAIPGIGPAIGPSAVAAGFLAGAVQQGYESVSGCSEVFLNDVSKMFPDTATSINGVLGATALLASGVGAWYLSKKIQAARTEKKIHSAQKKFINKILLDGIIKNYYERFQKKILDELKGKLDKVTTKNKVNYDTLFTIIFANKLISTEENKLITNLTTSIEKIKKEAGSNNKEATATKIENSEEIRELTNKIIEVLIKQSVEEFINQSIKTQKIQVEQTKNGRRSFTNMTLYDYSLKQFEHYKQIAIAPPAELQLYASGDTENIIFASITNSLQTFIFEQNTIPDLISHLIELNAIKSTLTDEEFVKNLKNRLNLFKESVEKTGSNVMATAISAAQITANATASTHSLLSSGVTRAVQGSSTVTQGSSTATSINGSSGASQGGRRRKQKTMKRKRLQRRRTQRRR